VRIEVSMVVSVWFVISVANSAVMYIVDGRSQCELDSSGSGYWPVADSCEHNNE
jgi:hypothetical protein